VDAVRKIREVLGPTDPSKALPERSGASLATIMVNAAHAFRFSRKCRPRKGIVKFAKTPETFDRKTGSANSVAPCFRTEIPRNQNTMPMELASRATILTPSLTLSIDSKAKAMKAEASTFAASARASRLRPPSTSRPRRRLAIEAAHEVYAQLRHA